jgi:hypothetical protein
MHRPPNLTRVRELVRLIEQEVRRLEADPNARDPAVPSLATYVGELASIIDALPPSSSADTSEEVKREMRWLSRRAIAEASWWLIKQRLFGSGDD